MNGPAKAICVAVLVGLTGFLFYSFATGQVIADQFHVWESVWGRYVWADTYAGFALFSLVVYAFERKVGLTLGLFLLTCATGNMINAAWLLWRGPVLFRRIAGERA